MSPFFSDEQLSKIMSAAAACSAPCDEHGKDTVSDDAYMWLEDTLPESVTLQHVCYDRGPPQPIGILRRLQLRWLA